MKSKKLTFYITIFIISTISIFFIFNKKVNKFSKTMYYLGTVNEITIYTNSNEEKANKILSKCEEIIKDIVRRDEIDSNREFAPLVKAEDAIEIDTTGKSIDEVVDYVLSKINL